MDDVPPAFFKSSGLIKASVAPKSTVFAINCWIPPPDPINLVINFDAVDLVIFVNQFDADG